MPEQIKMFRALRADEVELRVGRNEKQEFKWVDLLLYKDARCDQNILDETVGPMNWQRHHSRDNANCTVAIYNRDTGAWIEKEDTGTESNTEAQKGLASDSFKRACVNWGIGRELYTAPRIRIWKTDLSGKENFETREWNGKLYLNADFFVDRMEVQNGRITELRIKNRDRSNKVVFEWTDDPVAKNQEQLDLPEEKPPIPGADEPLERTGQAPTTYRRQDEPEPSEDHLTANQLLQEFKAKYGKCKKPAGLFVQMFEVNAESTQEELQDVREKIRSNDYTGPVEHWNVEVEKNG